MKESEKQQWEPVRAKGYKHFLLCCLLRAGLPFGIFMTLVVVLSHVLIDRSFPSIPELLVKYGIYSVGFGVLTGVWNWHINERNFRKPTDDEDSHHSLV